jgi:hypothetical protein
MSGRRKGMALEGETISCDSKITGKLVRIRHAVEADAVFIEKALAGYGLDTAGVNYGGYVVAEEDGEILGFGSMRKMGRDGRQLSVLIDEKNSYLSELIVKHLVQYPAEKG